MAQLVKTVSGLAIASVKTFQGLAIASAKTIMGVDNTGGGGGGIAVVAHLGQGLGLNGGTSSSIDTTGANLLIAAVSSYEAFAAPAFSDSKSNTYTALTEVSFSASVRIKMYYCASPAVGSGHTWTTAGSTSASSVCVLAVSGANGTPADQENGSTAVGSSAQPGSITPSVNNCIVVLSGAADADTVQGTTATGYTVSDSFATSGGNYFGNTMLYKIQTSASAENPTLNFSGSANLTVKIASFKPA